MDPVTVALGLANLAPSLLRWFGAGERPVAVAEKAVAIARAVTGAADGESALATLEAHPELAQEYRLAILKADAELEAAYLADRQDARRRDVSLAQAGVRNRRADWMVVLDVVGLLGCLVAVVGFRQSLSGEAVALVSTLASFFGLGLRDAHQFEFGSSRGSREKDQILKGPAP